MSKLKGKRVAILATEGFERSELMEPRKALEKAEAIVEIVALKGDEIRSWSKDDWGEPVDVDVLVDEVFAADYDCLMLPGGVINSDHLRNDRRAVEFVREFAEEGKPIAAICHAPWILIETGHAKGRTMTSWPSLKTDLQNAGVNWMDIEVVTDNGWVTSRKPADLPAFNKKMIEEFAEGIHSERRDDYDEVHV